MIVLSLHATLTGAEEKKTGPSRFRPLFLGGWVDTNSEAGSWEPEWLVYRAHTGGLQPVYSQFTRSIHSEYTRLTKPGVGSLGMNFREATGTSRVDGKSWLENETISFCSGINQKHLYENPNKIGGF